MSVYCGHTYFLFLPVAGKGKLLVPAYIQPITDKVRFFVINKERTEYQRNNDKIASHVIPIRRDDNRIFLTRDSWLTCHEVVGGYAVPEIIAINNCYRGPLDDVTLTTVRNLIAESRLYSEKEKSLILSQWP